MYRMDWIRRLLASIECTCATLVGLSRIHALEVARLDLKPLNVRGAGPKRDEVISLHLSGISS
jgi:hypothetical protein